MQSPTVDEQAKLIPRSFLVSVIAQTQPASGEWASEIWQAIGIAVTDSSAGNEQQTEEPLLISEHGEIRQYLYPDFEIELYPDQCESYYYNIISDNPRAYVVASKNDDEHPSPFLVSMSFDEAHSYLEGDDEIYDVDVPPEIYRWVEMYVVAHYTPEIRKKRKRDNWKNNGQKI